jgi:two-component system LytT family response regulator
VLKPFTCERIGEALEQAFRRTESERIVELIEALPHLREVPGPGHPKIAIKTKQRILVVNPDDLIAVQTERNYALLQHNSGCFLLRESISVVAEKLKPCGFIRIHRSALVNPRFVEEINPYPTGEYGLRVKGGKEYIIRALTKRILRPSQNSGLVVVRSLRISLLQDPPETFIVAC